jgi:hypothetical protein
MGVSNDWLKLVYELYYRLKNISNFFPNIIKLLVRLFQYFHCLLTIFLSSLKAVKAYGAKTSKLFFLAGA